MRIKVHPLGLLDLDRPHFIQRMEEREEVEKGTKVYPLVNANLKL